MEKEESGFYKRNDGYKRHECIECRNNKIKQKRKTDEDFQMRARNCAKKQRLKLKEFIDSKREPCAVCGEAEKACIDFHHVNPSEKSFDVNPRNSKSIANLQKEIDKCVCLCANCHRKVHAGLIDLSAYTTTT